MTVRKKIFIVSNTSWSISNFRQSIIKRMISNGFSVYCIAPEDNYSKDLEALGATFIHVDIDARGTNPVNDLRYYFKLRSIYKQYKPDFIFHYTIKPNIYGAFAAGSLNIPSISVVSGAGIVFLKKNLLYVFVKWLYRNAAKKALEVWFINNDDIDFFVNEHIVPKEKTEILPGEGIDTERFSRSIPYSQIAGSSFTFLFSARLLLAKGIMYYVESARKLKQEYKNARFLIIGFFDDETDKNAITKAQMSEWEKEGIVEYHGSLKDVKPLLDTIHCLVFPSFYREGIPKVLLEAASMEVPIVTTDNVGCRDVVQHKVNGLLCTPKSSEEVYLNMKKILESPREELISMGRRGREIILQKFDEKYVIIFYENALSKYLS